MARQFATAGELLVGFANSVVWQFAGPDTSANVSILDASLVQPLLRGAGKDRGLEQLTRVERGLLANVRTLTRYQQGFYTQAAVGSLGVSSVSRLGGFTGGTGLTGFTGTGQSGLGGVGQATGFGGGFGGGGGADAGAGGGAGLAGGGAGAVGGFVGLLQSLQEIRNAQYSLDLQLRTLALLEANLEAGTIDLTQVDQFRQNIETLRAQLLQANTSLEAQLDNFKTGTLGLPPDLKVKLDDQFTAQFRLIDPQITQLQDRIVAFQDELGQLPVKPDAESLRKATVQAEALLAEFHQQFRVTQGDLEKTRTQTEIRVRSMTPSERRLFERDIQQVADEFAKRPAQFTQLESDLESLQAQVDEQDRQPILSQLVGWARALGDQVQSLSLIQARARLEGIVLEPVELDASVALDIARANRLDYMNNRAALVDSWRLIAFNADQLKSVLDVELNGDVGTVGDNPLDFRGSTGRMRASLEFDAPLMRLLERNNYRQSLVDYQRSRRQLIQFDDTLNQSLRQRLRNLEQLRVNLEIQRRAVVISIRRVDFTRNELNKPLPTPVPGAAPTTFGPTAVQNLLSALSDLSNAQNNFMSVWLNYYAERMLLVRDLGMMELDGQGRWIDRPLNELLNSISCQPADLPPDVPQQWWDMTQPDAANAPENLPPPAEPPPQPSSPPTAPVAPSLQEPLRPLPPLAAASRPQPTPSLERLPAPAATAVHPDATQRVY